MVKPISRDELKEKIDRRDQFYSERLQRFAVA